LDQFDSEALGNDIGYLPQDIELFEGTVGNNVARFDPSTSSDKIIAAARAAGAHEMILHLPDGYDTRIGVGGARLSAGQRQRIALARALYGDPFLIVLDEPNSNLDAEGETALTGAIAAARQRGAAVIVIAHRPAALAAVNLVAVMANGQLRAFGPKEEVMAKAIQPVSTPAYAPAPATMARSQERTEMHSGGQVL
jgi:ATP-binding cassette subfamily C protein